jgi:hypothetical protein
MTDYRIVGDIGIGGLGYVNAIVISRPNRIYSPIRFCVDTGCSVTIISHLDALRIGLNYNSLQKSDQKSLNGLGDYIPYILPTTEILFTFEGTSLLEYVGDIHIMPPRSRLNNNNNNSGSSSQMSLLGIQISLLGIDVLKKFTISFSQNNIILGK